MNEAIWRQTFSIIPVALCIFNSGSTLGWLTMAIPKLLKPDGEFSLTGSETSSIAVISEIGNAIAVLVGGVMSDRFGRKKTAILCALLALSGWSIVAFTRSIYSLLLGRFLLGLAFGVGSFAAIYVGEIVSAEIRGATVVSLSIGFSLGLLSQFVIGEYLNYGQAAYVTMGISALVFVATFFVVESPYYLISRGKTAAAKKNLSWLRATTEDEITREINMITLRMKRKMSATQSLNEIFSCELHRRTMFLLLVKVILMEFTGAYVLVAYAATNFTDSTFLTAGEFTIIFGLLKLGLTFVPFWLSDLLGRKPLFVTTSFIGGFALFYGGVLYFLRLKMGTVITYYPWLIFISITLFNCCVTIGMISISILVRGELLPPNIRGSGNGVILVVSALVRVICVKFYQIASDGLGSYVVFWFFSTCCFGLSVFVYKYIPETKGRSLEQIQDDLQKNKNFIRKANSFALSDLPS